MRKARALRLLALAAVFLVAIGFVPGAAAGGTPAGAGGRAVVSHAITLAEQQAALRYWTPARMASAKALDVVAVAGTGHAAHTNVIGVPRSVAPVGAEGETLDATPVTATAAAGPTSFAYPFPFNRHQVFPTSLWKKAPWRVNGKVFFTQAGVNYVCSGTSVVSPDKQEVWTAGHCTSDAGVWDSNFVFVPAYNGYSASCPGTQCPYGVWAADNLGTTTAWLNTGDFTRDLGSAHIALLGGKKLGAMVGMAGYAWNQSRDQQFTDFGYPQASPFNGLYLTECDAVHAIDDTGIGGVGPDPIGIGCDMTGGSSGGSWNILWGGSAGNSPGYINGHNDYKYTSPAQPLAMYSPYFDDTANSVRCLFYTPGSGTGC